MCRADQTRRISFTANAAEHSRRQMSSCARRFHTRAPAQTVSVNAQHSANAAIFRQPKRKRVCSAYKAVSICTRNALNSAGAAIFRQPKRKRVCSADKALSICTRNASVQRTRRKLCRPIPRLRFIQTKLAGVPQTHLRQAHADSGAARLCADVSLSAPSGIPDPRPRLYSAARRGLSRSSRANVLCGRRRCFLRREVSRAIPRGKYHAAKKLFRRSS